ncbi:hypothetical protein E4U21_005119 [Claviceps maximensis]|nr:hypothetical protein E4U21_005119 [Claviceps maximensis]
MNYCGIRHLKHNSIPFGARAIEQGQKVEGIWNSCREISQPSQATSSATLENDHNNLPPQHEGEIYSSLHGIQEEIARPTSSSSSAVTHSSSPSSTYHDCHSISHPEDDVDEMATLPIHTDENSRTCQPLKADEVSFWDLNIASTSPLPAAVESNNVEPLLNCTRAHITIKGRAYGSAQVYANTKRRNMNSGFEILPAGTLGARPEFQIPSPALRQSDQ